MAGHGLAHVGEAATVTEIARQDPGTEPQHRHDLAGVVSAGPGRVAAVVGRDQREVAGAQPRAEFRKSRVEGLQRRRIARYVAPMAKQRVEVDEVGEDEAVVRPAWR
jgi:hypothetical protein